MTIAKDEDISQSTAVQEHARKLKGKRGNLLYTSMHRQYGQLREDHREKALKKLQRLQNPMLRSPMNYKDKMSNILKPTDPFKK